MKEEILDDRLFRRLRSSGWAARTRDKDTKNVEEKYQRFKPERGWKHCSPSMKNDLYHLAYFTCKSYLIDKPLTFRIPRMFLKAVII